MRCARRRCGAGSWPPARRRRGPDGVDLGGDGVRPRSGPRRPVRRSLPDPAWRGTRAACRRRPASPPRTGGPAGSSVTHTGKAATTSACRPTSAAAVRIVGTTWSARVAARSSRSPCPPSAGRRRGAGADRGRRRRRAAARTGKPRRRLGRDVSRSPWPPRVQRRQEAVEVLVEAAHRPGPRGCHIPSVTRAWLRPMPRLQAAARDQAEGERLLARPWGGGPGWAGRRSTVMPSTSRRATAMATVRSGSTAAVGPARW